MTKRAFENQINWDEYGIGHIYIHIPLFEKSLEFELFALDEEHPAISEKMGNIIQDVIDLPATSLEIIKDLLWEECHFSFTVVNYGCVPKDGETEIEAHFREFGLQSREDVLQKSTIKSVQIQQENDHLKGRYAEIKIETATDNLISIIVKNGKVIDFDDDGNYIAEFENDEQHAHHNRRRVLGE